MKEYQCISIYDIMDGNNLDAIRAKAISYGIKDFLYPYSMMSRLFPLLVVRNGKLCYSATMPDTDRPPERIKPDDYIAGRERT